MVVVITDNSSTKRFYVSITYTNMRAADGSDECALAWTWFWLVLKGLSGHPTTNPSLSR